MPSGASAWPSTYSPDSSSRVGEVVHVLDVGRDLLRRPLVHRHVVDAGRGAPVVLEQQVLGHRVLLGAGATHSGRLHCWDGADLGFSTSGVGQTHRILARADSRHARRSRAPMILPELDQQLDSARGEPAPGRARRRWWSGSTSRSAQTWSALWLTGSFALGAGDVHADVDFVVVTARPLTESQEQPSARSTRCCPIARSTGPTTWRAPTPRRRSARAGRDREAVAVRRQREPRDGVVGPRRHRGVPLDAPQPSADDAGTSGPRRSSTTCRQGVLRQETADLAVARTHDIGGGPGLPAQRVGATARGAHPLPDARHRHASRGAGQGGGPVGGARVSCPGSGAT